MSLFVLILPDLCLGQALGGIGIGWGIKHLVAGRTLSLLPALNYYGCFQLK